LKPLKKLSNNIDDFHIKTEDNVIFQERRHNMIRNPFIYERIEKVNDLLSKHLIQKTKNKKHIILDLSGGHDTRVNLAIFLKNNISFTAYTYRLSKKDDVIAKKISKQYDFPHIYNIKKDKCVIEDIYDRCDIWVNGGGYSEIMCVMHKMNRSYKMIKKTIIDKKNQEKRYSPAIEKDVRDAINNIPLCYLMGGIVQKIIISMNEPDLLKIPFTYYDFRHLLLNKYYMHFADFAFNSYYKGNGRNYFDDKKTKDVWWKSDYSLQQKH